jgi:hypothetical protein
MCPMAGGESIGILRKAESGRIRKDVLEAPPVRKDRAWLESSRRMRERFQLGLCAPEERGLMIEAIGPPLDDYTVAEMAVEEYRKHTAPYRDKALLLAIFPVPQLSASVGTRQADVESHCRF